MIIRSIFRSATFVLTFVLVAGCTQTQAQDAAHGVTPQSDQVANPSDNADPKASLNDNQPSANAIMVPLTPREKLAYGFRRAFLEPTSYLRPALSAYLIQRSDVKAPGKTAGDRYADGLSRYARSFATRNLGQLFAHGVYPALFKQDPRYQASNKKGFMPRMLHAASRTVLTQGDNGKTQINYSRLAGHLTSASLANIYERDTVGERDALGNVVSFDRRVGAGPTFRRFGMSIPLGAASNIIFKEFDLDGRLGKAVRRIVGKQ